MKQFKKYLLVQAIVIICLFITPNNPAPAFEGRVYIEHARGFSVEYNPGYSIISVKVPWPGAPEPARYVLVQRGYPVPEGFKRNDIIEVPVKSCVSTTTVNLVFMKELGVIDTLAGQGGKAYVYDPPSFMKDIPEVGTGAEMDLERLLELAPDVIFAYTYSSVEKEMLNRLRSMGLKVVLMSEYNETSPLGRAEWIKFLSLFFCKTSKAEKIFAHVSDRYTELAARGCSIEDKPLVLPNIAYNGIWYVPGGSNWVARLFQDAGAQYPWSEDRSEGSLALDLETVLAKASDADIWLNPGGCNTLEELQKVDDRYGLFKAFRAGQVYNNNKRTGSGGANDYHQRGVLHPEEILEDILAILHPRLFPDHKMMYYKKLD